jgi:hypothetical protein
LSGIKAADHASSVTCSFCDFISGGGMAFHRHQAKAGRKKRTSEI